jgi:DNA-binding response OmpR family regulator
MSTAGSNMQSQPSPYRIAVVEDDGATSEAICKWLGELGHSPAHFSSGEQLLATVAAGEFALYILDWGLPGMPGIDIVRQLRGSLRCEAPVIFCTSRDAEADVVDALRAGADDFIVKPVRKNELSARIAAALRRAYPVAPASHILDIPPYAIHLLDRTIALRGEVADLQNREYELALMLFQNLNGVVSRERLIQSLWGNVPMETSRSLDTHASRIRRKLNLTPENGIILQSVYGKGYRLQAVDRNASR